MPPNLALLRLLLIRLVPFLKFLSVQMMKISCIASPEEGPIPSGFHPLHEQIRNPIRSIHVMTTPTIISRVLP